MDDKFITLVRMMLESLDDIEAKIRVTTDEHHKKNVLAAQSRLLLNLLEHIGQVRFSGGACVVDVRVGNDVVSITRDSFTKQRVV